MVTHRNEIIAFQEMLKETSGLTNGYNKNNETKTKDFIGATLTSYNRGQTIGQIAPVLKYLERNNELLGFILILILP